jgi:hypothetical protein
MRSRMHRKLFQRIRPQPTRRNYDRQFSKQSRSENTEGGKTVAVKTKSDAAELVAAAAIDETALSFIRAWKKTSADQQQAYPKASPRCTSSGAMSRAEPEWGLQTQ